MFRAEEGLLTLWRGSTPTIARAIVVNAAQLGTYSQAKESLKKSAGFSEGIGLHFCASMISGLITTIASMPVDIVKTRLQNQKVIIITVLLLLFLLLLLFSMSTVCPNTRAWWTFLARSSRTKEYSRSGLVFGHTTCALARTLC